MNKRKTEEARQLAIEMAMIAQQQGKGAPPPSIRDRAAYLGVSPTTVARRDRKAAGGDAAMTAQARQRASNIRSAIRWLRREGFNASDIRELVNDVLAEFQETPPRRG